MPCRVSTIDQKRNNDYLSYCSLKYIEHKWHEIYNHMYFGTDGEGKTINNKTLEEEKYSLEISSLNFKAILLEPSSLFDIEREDLI